MQRKTETWLLLLYGLSARHGTARVSLWRKLKKFGALPLKTSAYVLPDEPVHYERFQWLAKQIQDDGGEATLIRVAEIEGLSNDRIAQLFNEARTAEYKKLMTSIQKSLANKKSRRTIPSRGISRGSSAGLTRSGRLIISTRQQGSTPGCC